MKPLLQAIQRLAARQGIFMYWGEIDTKAAPAQAKARLKVQCDMELELFIEGQFTNPLKEELQTT